ncbi:MAG: methylcrotonoyl-CoA carboxylase, partial [Vicinamibacteria bacterium]
MEKAPLVSVIRSQIKTDSADYRENYAHNLALHEDLQRKLERARLGGDEKSHARHREQGKLFVRDRIAKLCDEGSPFLEIGPLAG